MADKVSYVSNRSGLELVKVPMGLKDAVGNKIKTVRCQFKHTQYGAMYVTSDPEIIKWLDNHEYMVLGKIHRFNPATDVPEMPNKGISAGGVTASPERKPEAPASGPRVPVKGAKVGK